MCFLVRDTSLVHRVYPTIPRFKEKQGSKSVTTTEDYSVALVIFVCDDQDLGFADTRV